ncbi:hypothetical protein M8J77_012595 [Diaphorina citri]|nr:hypothetical protein M8J77_012595 [Diaphorina citri]
MFPYSTKVGNLCNTIVKMDKLISIELEQNEILEKLDMLQKTVNHLMTRREAASSSTELQDLLKKLPLKTPLDFEIFQDNLTDSGQRALVQHFKLVSVSHLLNFVRNIIRSIFKDECLTAYC